MSYRLVFNPILFIYVVSFVLVFCCLGTGFLCEALAVLELGWRQDDLKHSKICLSLPPECQD